MENQDSEQNIPLTPPEPNPNLSKSSDSREIVVILLLIFFYPVGVILMWMWMKTWPTVVKIILSVVLLLPILAVVGIILAIVVTVTDPLGKNAKYNHPTPTLVQKQTSAVNPWTANWKTYKNNEFGYEIKFPTNWFLQGPYGGQAGYDCADISSDVVILEISQAKLTNCGFVGEQLPPPQADVTIWVNKKPWPDINVLGKPDGNLMVSGENAAKYIFTDKSPLPNIQATRLYFNHNGKGYLIFLKQTDKEGAYNPIYDQLLSTFKFTDQIATPSPIISGVQTPTPTCMPRPACLDATPRCMIAEPAEGWCPK